ncbi:uncharacterized protein LOC124942808 [Impatiens glandulifera]|uniref:uncharacterized protein LOC124942808 n=1 Tax=Impatiens glandulifera TaxID=253017 RepID=UPI001FB08E87|nr:uncharacterized protein LOC124942808 [Impatiens glandulifera]
MVGKLQVLKPSAREKNGAPLISKDSCSSPTDDSVIPSSPSSAVTPDRRQTPSILEKRLTQAQSRNNFFNLVRKNSMSSPSFSVVTGSSSSVAKQSGGDSVVDESTMKANNSENGCLGESDNYLKTNPSNTDTILYSEEKEAAFLRSLGWEEKNDNGDDEGLTEEEISAFYKYMNEYIKLRPTCKTSQKIHPKFFEPRNLSMDSKEGATFCGSEASS